MKFTIGDGSVESAWVDVIADDGTRIYRRSLYSTYALLPMLRDECKRHYNDVTIYNEEMHSATTPDELEVIYAQLEEADELLRMKMLLIANDEQIRFAYHNRL
jgi:hypothetical protein